MSDHRRKLSQRGGKNRCSYKKNDKTKKNKTDKIENRKYACNYGNIKAQRCPGYIAGRNGKRYSFTWNSIGTEPEGEDWTGKSGTRLHYQLNGGPAPGQTNKEIERKRGNDTQCLPRYEDATDKSKKWIIPDDDDNKHWKEPNFYCEEYKSVRGCASDPKKRSKKKSGTLREEVRKQQSERSSSDTDDENIKKIKKTIDGERRSFYIHDNEYLEVIQVQDGPRRGQLGLFAKEDIPKDHTFPYIGTVVRKAPKNDKYIFTADDKTIIDGNPLKATSKKKAVSLVVFANEPSIVEQPNEPSIVEQPNAIFEGDEDRVYLKTTEIIKKNQEILVCYGDSYENRGYKTSCTQSQTSSSKSSSKSKSPVKQGSYIDLIADDDLNLNFGQDNLLVQEEDDPLSFLYDKEQNKELKLDKFQKNMIDLLLKNYQEFITFLDEKWPEVRKLQRQDLKRDNENRFWSDKEWAEFLTVLNGIIHLKDKSEKELIALNELQLSIEDNGNDNIYLVLEYADRIFGPAHNLLEEGIEIPDLAELASVKYGSSDGE